MESKNKKLYIETLGCQMNKSDSERIKGIMSHFGYIENREDDADFLIVNTCSIRKLSEDKAYSKLGNWGARKKEGRYQNRDLRMCCTAGKRKSLKKISLY